MPLFLLSSEGGDPILRVLQHALDHTLFHLGPIPVSKFSVMVAISAAVLVLMAMMLNRASPVPRGFLRNAMESLMLFIRDEMARPVMGKQYADRFLPFFCTIFLFILTMNLLGMVPIPVVGGTATSALPVTGILAAIVLLVSIGSGLVLHGPGGFMKIFVPPGLPTALVPLLFVLELVGFFIKHAVLMVRLFANMIAGHLVIGAFIGLIFLAKSYGVAGPSILLALFISLVELLVAFLQAYVFTLLSVLFIGGVVHPEH